MSLAQARGAGCGWEDTGHSAGLWLEEGPVGPWGCCVGGEARLCFPWVEVMMRANGPGMWQCCFLGESPSSPEAVTSSLPDCTQHLPWRGTVNFDSAGKKKKKKGRNQSPLFQLDSKYELSPSWEEEIPSSSRKILCSLALWDRTAPGCSATGCPEVLPQFSTPGCTELPGFPQPGRGSGHREGLLP